MSLATPKCGSIASAECDLETTVDLFSSRLARKLKERDQDAVAKERAYEMRQAMLLEAMTAVRKALQQTSRIQLGDRFSFALSVDDLDGWPRVTLKLIDLLAPKSTRYAFSVSVLDRNHQGIVEMSAKGSPILNRIPVAEKNDLERVALSFKKSIRGFLDNVAAYVLNPERPEDLLEQESKPIEIDLLDQKLQKEDLFSEERLPDDNRVQIATTGVKPLAL